MVTLTRRCVQGVIVFIALCVCHSSIAYEAIADKTKKNDEQPDCNRQFTFSWSLLDKCGLTPRGGTSRGAEITLDSKPHEGWLSLQEPGLKDFEKDRRAILAMAGPYRTSFDFLETVGYTTDFKPDKPYQSWGTEYVYVVEDRGDFISLQHIMVMVFKQENGEISEPMVMKHWRQDWQYQRRTILTYVGNNTWELKKLPKRAVKGKWAQAVYQVDDSPRYESVGAWDHRANFSIWTSDVTWRPLPRREHSVRDDYDVLEGVNKHTILPNGWVHEQENYKLKLNNNADQKDFVPYLAKELGVNRYEKIVNHDFSAGDKYWDDTKAYWRDVRAQWQQLIDSKKRFTLKKTVDNTPLFMPLFQYAESHGNSSYNSAEGRKYIEEILARYTQ